MNRRTDRQLILAALRGEARRLLLQADLRTYAGAAWTEQRATWRAEARRLNELADQRTI